MQARTTAAGVAPQRSCLRRFSGGPQSRVRLVCFPWAGAGASVFRRFAGQLPESIELLAVQLPAREDRFSEKGLVRMETVVAQIISDLIRLSDRPLVFFGHSMGSLVAYEVAQSLKINFGREPEMLIVSGSGSPGSEEIYERCPGNATEEEFIADMRRLGGTPPEILADRQVMRTLLPAIRADYELLDTYEHRRLAQLSCPIVVCGSDADPSISRNSVEGWFRHTTGRCRQHWFSGDHFYLCFQPLPLTQCLREWITQTVLSRKPCDIPREWRPCV